MKHNHISCSEPFTSLFKTPLKTVIISTIPKVSDFKSVFSVPYLNIYELRDDKILCCVMTNDVSIQSEMVRTIVNIGVEKLVLIGSGKIIDENDDTKIVLVEDHINLSGANPLIGINSATLEVIFQDISDLYDTSCSDVLKSFLLTDTVINKGTALIARDINMLTEIEKKAIEIFQIVAYTKDIFPFAVLARYMGLKKVIGIILSNELDYSNDILNNLIKFFIEEGD